MNNDDFSTIAQKYEKKVAELYIAATVEALLFVIAIVPIIFYRAGFSSFSLMQAIGFILLVLFISSVVIYLRKRHTKNLLLKELSDPDSFKAFLEQNPTQFEFTLALMTPKKDLSSIK